MIHRLRSVQQHLFLYRFENQRNQNLPISGKPYEKLEKPLRGLWSNPQPLRTAPEANYNEQSVIENLTALDAACADSGLCV